MARLAYSVSVFAIALLIAVLNLSCTQNVLRELGNPNTDEAILTQIKIDMNAGDWTDAISGFSDLTSTVQAKRSTQLLYASAYAGRCGYEFFQFIEDFGNMGAQALMMFLMTNYTGATAAQAADCLQAENILKGIDTDAANRTSEENLLMAMLGLTKLGTYLTVSLDTTPADGTVDNTGADEACDPAPLDDTEIGEIGTGLTLFLTSIAATGASVGSGTVTDLTALCASLPPGYDFCSKTDASTFTADELKGIRTLINEGDSFGVSTCSNGTPSLVNCVCP